MTTKKSLSEELTEPFELRRVSPTISQLHLALLLKTVLGRESGRAATIRMLDMGCGDAHLLAYLAQSLPEIRPDLRFEFYGFEVGDIGWHQADYLAPTLEFLHERAPGFTWDQRIALLSASDRWPYQDDSFDVVISNQVLEHVRDHALVFGEIRRCLAPGGFSAHLFPLAETIYEVHAHMPIVHWIRDSRQRQMVMWLWAQLGLRRKYAEEIHFRGWKNLEEFATIYSDVLGTMTNYKSSRQIVKLAAEAGLQADFAYTRNFFSTKLLSVIKRKPSGYGAPTWIDRAVFPLLKRLSPATLTLRKPAAP